MTKQTRTLCTLALVLACSRVWAQEPSVLIQQAKVAQQPISEILTVYGQVQADPDSVQTISLLHDALITRVAVRPGQRVKRRRDPFGADHITGCTHGISEGARCGGLRAA